MVPSLGLTHTTRLIRNQEGHGGETVSPHPSGGSLHSTSTAQLCSFLIPVSQVLLFFQHSEISTGIQRPRSCQEPEEMMFRVGSLLSLLMEKKLSVEGTFTQKKFKSLILPGQPLKPLKPGLITTLVFEHHYIRHLAGPCRLSG